MRYVLLLSLLLAGCAAPLKQVVGESTAAPVGALAIDPQAGSVGPLKLGMTSAQAIAALGPPEIQQADFLSWSGVGYMATLRDDRIVRLQIADKTASIKGFRIGDSLDTAKLTLPGGTLVDQEVPAYILPGDSPHVRLDLSPDSQHDVLDVVLSSDPPNSDGT